MHIKEQTISFLSDPLWDQSGNMPSMPCLWGVRRPGVSWGGMVNWGTRGSCVMTAWHELAVFGFCVGLSQSEGELTSRVSYPDTQFLRALIVTYFEWLFLHVEHIFNTRSVKTCSKVGNILKMCCWKCALKHLNLPLVFKVQIGQWNVVSRLVADVIWIRCHKWYCPVVSFSDPVNQEYTVADVFGRVK